MHNNKEYDRYICSLIRLIKHFITLIFRHFSFNIIGNTPLQGRIHQSIIIPCSIDVEIKEVINILDIPTRHFKHRQANDLIIGRCKPLAVRIFKISLFYQHVKVDSKRTQMRDFLWNITIQVACFLFISVYFRPAVFDKIIIDPILQ